MPKLGSKEFIAEVKRHKEGLRDWGLRREIDYDYYVLLERGSKGEVITTISPVIYRMPAEERVAFEKEIEDLFPGVDLKYGVYFRDRTREKKGDTG
jgi:hypothetical protein